MPPFPRISSFSSTRRSSFFFFRAPKRKAILTAFCGWSLVFMEYIVKLTGIKLGSEARIEKNWWCENNQVELSAQLVLMSSLSWAAAEASEGWEWFAYSKPHMTLNVNCSFLNTVPLCRLEWLESCCSSYEESASYSFTPPSLLGWVDRVIMFQPAAVAL